MHIGIASKNVKSPDFSQVGCATVFGSKAKNEIEAKKEIEAKNGFVYFA
jgi:hypothetical protein